VSVKEFHLSITLLLNENFLTSNRTVLAEVTVIVCHIVLLFISPDMWRHLPNQSVILIAFLMFSILVTVFRHMGISVIPHACHLQSFKFRPFCCSWGFPLRKIMLLASDTVSQAQLAALGVRQPCLCKETWHTLDTNVGYSSFHYV